MRLGADALVSVLTAIAARATPRPEETGASGSATGAARAAELRELVYELLDAHYDTAVLAQKLACDASWSAHLQYLSELQRVGRERLAETSTERVA